MSFYESNPEFYDYKEALKYEADRDIIFGERQGGKTSSVFGNLIDYVVNETNYERQFAYIRRRAEDIRGGAGDLIFNNLLGHDLDWVSEITKGKYNTIYHRAQRWYFANVTNNGEIKDKRKEPFCLGFAIGTSQRYRGGQYPLIDVAYWDEFLTLDGMYLRNELSLFTDIVSSIKRRREKFKVIMTANTIDREAPIWHDLNIYEIIKYMKPGEYRLLDTDFNGEVLKTYIKYTLPPEDNAKYNKLYAGSNISGMITKGEWITDQYPILPDEPDLYRPKHIKYTYFIKVYDEIFEGNIITRTDKKHHYMYIHKPYNLPEKFDKYLVFSTDYDLRYNYRRDILRPTDDITKMIASFFKNDNVFYDSNTTGSMINTYLNMYA